MEHSSALSASTLLTQETTHDHQAVFNLNRAAFGQDGEALLVDRLRANPAVFIPELSIVATAAGGIVGYILFTRIVIAGGEDKLHESLALAPMAVLPGWQQNGIGGQLVRKGLEVATGMGFRSVIVLGHAQYYPRFGFRPAAEWKILPPFDVPPAAFMAIELTKGGLAHVSGLVRYPKEFEGGMTK